MSPLVGDELTNSVRDLFAEDGCVRSRRKICETLFRAHASDGRDETFCITTFRDQANTCGLQRGEKRSCDDFGSRSTTEVDDLPVLRCSFVASSPVDTFLLEELVAGKLGTSLDEVADGSRTEPVSRPAGPSEEMILRPIETIVSLDPLWFELDASLDHIDGRHGTVSEGSAKSARGEESCIVAETEKGCQSTGAIL